MEGKWWQWVIVIVLGPFALWRGLTFLKNLSILVWWNIKENIELRRMEPQNSQKGPIETIPGARAKLLKRISHNGDINDPTVPRPLVTLEEFFDGNNDYGSIGYNLAPQPSPREFYEALLKIRERSDVVDVLVEVKDLEEPEGWPSSDTVWVITSASETEISGSLDERFAPDEVSAGFPTFYQMEPCEIPHGTQPIGIWWD